MSCYFYCCIRTLGQVEVICRYKVLQSLDFTDLCNPQDNRLQSHTELTVSTSNLQKKMQLFSSAVKGQ